MEVVSVSEMSTATQDAGRMSREEIRGLSVVTGEVEEVCMFLLIIEHCSGKCNYRGQGE